MAEMYILCMTKVGPVEYFPYKYKESVEEVCICACIRRKLEYFQFKNKYSIQSTIKC